MKEVNLIEKYIRASICYGVAQEEGDSKKVNKQAGVIRKIRVELKKNLDSYVEMLEPLLEHENGYVRLKTAFSLLPFLSQKSEAVLLELSKKEGLLGFEADMTLKEWKKGNLIF